MDKELIRSKFEDIGARVVVADLQPRPWDTSLFRVDVRKDARGQFFEVLLRPGSGVDVEVIDLRPENRHLLLMVRNTGVGPRDEKPRFLCGHDEREWFAAAVPRRPSTVRDAMEALKPQAVRTSQARAGVKYCDRLRRRNAGSVRQGEWFFVPMPEIEIDDKLVLRDEPLQRGSGKPHRAESCYRVAGTRVYVCSQYPNGLSEAQYSSLIHAQPLKRLIGWNVRVRDPQVFVRGWIRHPDHKTVVLPVWHRVFPNTEASASGARNLAFLD